MPYPNEHAARVKSPAAFKPNSFRSKEVAPGVRIIMGKPKGGGGMTAQTYRFDASKFTASEAHEWLKKNKVEHIGFEAATGEGTKSSTQETAMEQTINIDRSKLITLVESFEALAVELGSDRLNAGGELKAGRRNNLQDQKRIQMIHDMTSEMGILHKGKEVKAGARFSGDDMDVVSKIHEMSVNLGAECDGQPTESTYPNTKTVDAAIALAQVALKKVSERDDTSKETGKTKYGDVTFADETNKKYPIDTEEHIKAAWNYINKENNAAKYDAKDLATIKNKIVAAWKDKIDKDGPPSAEAMKSESLQDLVQDIRDAWYMQWYEPEDEGVEPTDYPEELNYNSPEQWIPCPTIIDVLTDAIVVKIKGKEFMIPYTVPAVDEVEFGSPDTWEQVEYTWEKVSDMVANIDPEDLEGKTGHKRDRLLVAFGGEIKTAENGHLTGYLVRFTDKNHPDVTGDYFTKDTDFGFEKETASPLYFHHCLPVETKSGIVQIDDKIGDAILTIDDTGVFVDALLNERAKYVKAIKRAVKTVATDGHPLMGWSSGTAAHLVTRKKAGKSYEVTRWPLGLDATITHKPAELTNEVLYEMKSIYKPRLDVELPEELAETAVVDSGAGSEPTFEKMVEQFLEQTTIKGVKSVETKEKEVNLDTLASAIMSRIEAKTAEAEAAKKQKEADEKAFQEKIEAAVKSALKIVDRKPVNAGGMKTSEGVQIHDKTPMGEDSEGRQAWNWYLKTGDNGGIRADSQLYRSNEDLMEAALLSMKTGEFKTAYSLLEGTQYQGQELVPTVVYQDIQKLRDPQSIARAMGAQVIPVGTLVTNFPIEKNRSGRFVRTNEGTSYDSNSKQLLDKKAITVIKFTRTIPVSLEILQDSVVDVTAWWNQHVARMEALTENYEFFMSSDMGAQYNAGSAFTSAAGTAIAASEIVRLFYSLAQPYRDNVAMVCNGNTEGTIRALNGNWWQFGAMPMGSTSAGNFPMGADWIVSSKCKLMVNTDFPDIGVNAKALMVGNFNEYVIAERQAMVIFRDPYSSAGSGLVNFHCYFRRGGAPTISEAFKVITQKSA